MIFEDPSLPQQIDNSVHTVSDSLQRRIRFAKVLNVVALIYAFTHKFFVPLVLYLLNGKTEFRVIDWWWIYHAILAIILYRKVWDDSVLRLILGFGFGGLIVQSYDGLMAAGWHSFSLWLTTATSGAVLLYLTGILNNHLKKSLLFAASGLVVGLVVMSIVTILLGVDRYAINNKPISKLAAKEVINLDKAETCAVNAFRIPVKSGEIMLPSDTPVSNTLLVKDCGFSVALQQVELNQSFVINNSGKSFLNVRLNHLVGQRWRPLTNRPLRSGESLSLNLVTTTSDDLWAIESDSLPRAGLIILYANKNQFLNHIKMMGDPERVVFSREGVMTGD